MGELSTFDMWTSTRVDLFHLTHMSRSCNLIQYPECSKELLFPMLNETCVSWSTPAQRTRSEGDGDFVQADTRQSAQLTFLHCAHSQVCLQITFVSFQMCLLCSTWDGQLDRAAYCFFLLPSSSTLPFDKIFRQHWCLSVWRYFDWLYNLNLISRSFELFNIQALLIWSLSHCLGDSPQVAKQRGCLTRCHTLKVTRGGRQKTGR